MTASSLPDAPALGPPSQLPALGQPASVRQPEERRVPRLRTWLLGGVTLIVLASLLAVLVAVADGTETARQTLIQRLRPAQQATLRLMLVYAEQESGQWTYVLTGNQAGLDTYAANVRTGGELEDRLAVLLAGDADADALLRDVRAAAADWRATSARPAIEARRQQQLTPAQATTLAAAGEGRFENLRVALARLTAHVDERAQEQLRIVDGARSRSTRASALGALLAALAAAGTLVGLRRATSRPVDRLLGELTAVADGDLEQQITVQGPAELRVISAAAETMRTRLVDDAAHLADAQHQIGAFHERERMADQVCQHTLADLYHLGVSLSTLAAQQQPKPNAHLALIEQTDAIIYQLRSIIFPREDAEESPGPHAA